MQAVAVGFLRRQLKIISLTGKLFDVATGCAMVRAHFWLAVLQNELPGSRSPRIVRLVIAVTCRGPGQDYS